MGCGLDRKPMTVWSRVGARRWPGRVEASRRACSSFRPYHFPGAPHVDHGPALCRCLVESLVEGADVAFPVIGELPLRIRVMNKEGKARAVARRRPLRQIGRAHV